MIKQKTELEKRAYLQDSTTHEEIQAIKNYMSIYDPQVLIMKEVPVPSPFSVNILFDQSELLAKQLGKYGLIVDLRDTKRPDALTRRAINKRFTLICENLPHVAFCTGQNFLINTAVRFAMSQTGLDSYSVVKTIDEAVTNVKKAVNND